MIVIEALTFELGKFTVKQRPRFDNPAFAVFVVYHKEKEIGRGFSKPCLSDCEWMLTHPGDEPVYATPDQFAGVPRVYVVNRAGRPRRTLTHRGTSEREEGEVVAVYAAAPK